MSACAEGFHDYLKSNANSYKKLRFKGYTHVVITIKKVSGKVAFIYKRFYIEVLTKVFEYGQTYHHIIRYEQ